MTDERKQSISSELYPHFISRLINSIYYFFDVVLILDEGNGQSYHLIIQHNGIITMDKIYPSLRGAKIAFSKCLSCRAYKENVKADWSGFYEPIRNWMENILSSPREIPSEE